MRYFVLVQALSCLMCVSSALGQSAQSTGNSAVVPQLVNYSGHALDGTGKAITEIVGITFSIYSAQQGGAPLWMETQNVQPDAKGNYSVQLGATTSEGLPLDLFASGEARWLGMRVNGGEEQPRVLLLSVPYALKAADAQTLGGLPASAFVLAAPSATSQQATPEPASSSSAGSGPNIGGSGTEDYIPLWTDNNGDLGNSILYQLGTGSTAKIGINEKSPLFTLDVNGQELVRGLFEMATTNYANKNKGFDSNPLNFESSAFNSGTGAYSLNHFQWQAEPVGNDTTAPGATLNLLYGTDPASPVETGLLLNSNGIFTFATGQTFPGTGTITGITTASGSGLSGGGSSGNLNLGLVNTCATNQVLQWNGSAWACSSAGSGTITGVTAGTDLTGGGTSGIVTLNVDTTKVPQLNAANTFTGNQTVNGNLSATGTVSAANFEIGSNLFGFGSYANGNAFLGFAGSNTASGSYNTASGVAALQSLTSGIENTAVGYAALQGNTAAGSNTAIGYAALQITSGSFNTATGVQALSSNTTGVQNTANGVAALYSNTTGAYNTATGLNALKFNTIANYNTAVGDGALNSNTTTCCNTAVGYAALLNSNNGGSSSQPGAQNDAFGYEALYSNITGTNNAAFGSQALYSNSMGIYNTGMGYQALYSISNGSDSSAFGYQALYNSTGWPNDAFGQQALYANKSGAYNAAFGWTALNSNTTGTGNAAFGEGALSTNTTGSGNVAVGSGAFSWNGFGDYPNTGSGNVVVGNGAFSSNTTGSNNVAVGTATLSSLQVGVYNTGNSNVAVGAVALDNNTTGSNNTGVGYAALLDNFTSNNLTCVGYECGGSDGLTNATAIGAHAIVGQSNSLVLGGTGQWGVKVGIGTTEPSNILTIGRGLGHPVSDSWETYSSRRWKTNIKTLPDALAKVEQLRGVTYDLKDSGKHEVGVIAEEVGAVIPEVVTYEDNGKDARGVDYSRLTALLIEAVKQQQREIAVLHRQLQKRAAKEAALESRLEQLEQHRGETQLASANSVR